MITDQAICRQASPGVPYPRLVSGDRPRSRGHSVRKFAVGNPARSGIKPARESGLERIARCRTSSFPRTRFYSTSWRRSATCACSRRIFAGPCGTLALLLAHEAMVDLPVVESEVTTPLARTRCRVLKDSVGIFPILRAGLGMAEAVMELLPEAEVWHLGLYRDEATLMPKEYYNKLPAGRRVTVALLVDPMLATGGSAVHACEIIKSAGVPRLKLLSLIAAPEGIALMARVMPDVQIYVGAWTSA